MFSRLWLRKEVEAHDSQVRRLRLDWNVSIYQKIPRTGYICPHCESRLRAGETLPNIQASQKARPQRTKGATP